MTTVYRTPPKPISLSSFDADSDGDGIHDLDEVNTLGTAPEVADTDGDGFDDGYEVANRESQGLDPLWADERVDPSTYAWEFAQGALLGEIAPGDSLPWLAGNITAGSSSFIPGVGWVVGGAADLRDAVGSAIHADWVGAGFSVVGLVPVGGDAAAIPAKLAKFVARHPELAPAAGAAIAALTWIPTQVKIAALKSSSSGGWSTLNGEGISDEALLRLQQGRIAASNLANDMNRPGHVDGATGTFLADGPAGETFVEQLVVGPSTQVRFTTADCASVCNPVARIVDVVDREKVAHESKVGRVTLTPSIRMQIESDAYLVSVGAISASHWHFSASVISSTLGASKQVFDMLEEHGIRYTIHVPA